MPAVVITAGILVSQGAVALPRDLLPGDDLQTAISQASAGDVLRLAPGIYQGPFLIDQSVTIEGSPGTTLRGNGEGSAITITAPNATVRGVTIEGSGRDASNMDAGVFLMQSANGAVVEHSNLLDNLFGVYVYGTPDAQIRHNNIIGISEGRVSEAGNGVSLWNAPGTVISDNNFRYGRDGIFTTTSRRNVFARNRFQNVRFAVHYMYTNDSEVSDNVSIGNGVGYAIMHSDRLIIRGNISDNDRDHGLLFNYANKSEISGNLVIGHLQSADRWLGINMQSGGEHGVPASSTEVTGDMRIAPDKCVFIYNANGNVFRDNWFQGCEIGIHFTAGSEGNALSGNAFINNRTQVKYVGRRFLEWSDNGRGNYWSDNTAFDLNGDGIADTAYRPNNLADRVLWSTPQAKVLMNSPAVQIIRWSQSQFPALDPGGVVDSHPLLNPPPRPVMPAPPETPQSESAR